jgi:hypothetical protein
MELRPSMCRWPVGDPQHFVRNRVVRIANNLLQTGMQNRRTGMFCWVPYAAD